MHRLRQTVVAVAALLTAAVALSALTAGATAAQPTQIDSCTTINESGEHELDPAFEVGNFTEAVDANATDDNEIADEVEANGTADDTEANETGVNDADTDQTDAPGACILITASDVVLEGNDVVLDGDNVTAADLPDANGIDQNVTDSNGTEGNDAETNENVTDENGAAVDATVANESELTGIEVRPGPGEDEITNVTIRNVTVQNWHIGVSLQNVSGTNLENAVFTNNTVPGIHLENATDTTVESEQTQTSEVEE